MSFLINPFAFAVAGGDFESIATVTVGSGGASSISFTSIPSTYQHLQVRLIGRTARTGPGDDALGLRFNSDTGNNYALHVLLGNGSSASASAASSVNLIVGANVTSNSATSNTFGCTVVDILDYANTSKNKTVRALTGFETNTEGKIEVRSGLWMSTSAITSLVFASTISSNLLQYSTAALYGVKAP